MKISPKLHKVIENSTVRIMVESIDINWSLPFQLGNIGSGNGSGFFISKNQIASCSHVCDSGRNIYIEIPAIGSQKIPVKVVSICPKFDIALLEVPKEHESKHWFKLADSDKCQIGDEIIVCGYPKALMESKNNKNNIKLSQGIISGGQGGLIQCDGVLNAGCSGGPLLNSSGDVVGICSRKLVGEDVDSIGYTVPINNFKVIKDDLMKGKSSIIQRPALAFEYSNANQTLIETLIQNNRTDGLTGVYVSYIYPNSPLIKAGIKEGALITKIDGKDIDNFGMVDYMWFNTRQDLFTFINRFKNNSKVSIEFIQNGKKQKKMIELKPYIVPIRMMYPMYEEVPYFIFGGMVFMNLCMNHIEQSPEVLIRYVNAKEILEPKVIISFIFPNQTTSILNNFQKNDVIKKVNGMEIETLDDLQKAILKKNIHKKRSVIKFESADNYVMILDIEQMVLNDILLSQIYKFPLTPFHIQKIKELSLEKKIEKLIKESSKNK